MITKSENPITGNHSRESAFASSGRERKRVSPAERWLLITEKAYYRVQKRGFVGGDPFEDWAAAEREVDAIYDTEPQPALRQADADKLAEQVKRVFGGFGMGHLSLDTILEKHRDGLERLAEHNRKVVGSTSELASQQAALFQDAVNDAMETLHSFTQGKVSTDGFARQAERSTRAMENVLSYFKVLTESATGLSQSKGNKSDGDR